MGEPFDQKHYDRTLLEQAPSYLVWPAFSGARTYTPPSFRKMLVTRIQGSAARAAYRLLPDFIQQHIIDMRGDDDRCCWCDE